MLGLPDTIRACLFDLDGVLTTTAELHARGCNEMFGALLAEAGRRGGFVVVVGADLPDGA